MSIQKLHEFIESISDYKNIYHLCKFDPNKNQIINVVFVAIYKALLKDMTKYWNPTCVFLYK